MMQRALGPGLDASVQSRGAPEHRHDAAGVSAGRRAGTGQGLSTLGGPGLAKPMSGDKNKYWFLSG